ncbi:hypothetical protein EBZ35_06335 [bacterium]|nr:hypothetical protein [bacterium]
MSTAVWQGLLGVPVKVVYSLPDALAMVRLYPNRVRVVVVHDQFGPNSMLPFCRQFKRMTRGSGGVLVVSPCLDGLHPSPVMDVTTPYPYEWTDFTQRVRMLWRAYHTEAV